MSRSFPHPSAPRAGVIATAGLVVCAVGLLGLATAAAAARGQTRLQEADTTAIVEVSASDAVASERLWALELDVLDHHGVDFDIMLHGAQDAAALREAGFGYRIVVADVEAAGAAAAAAEAARAEQIENGEIPASPLPTGRVDYRTMEETNEELHELAATFPDRVRLFELPHRSLLGRRIFGIHVSRDPDGRSGRPVFLNTGVNHAREWPTVEFTMEFAWDVLTNDGDDPRITSVLDRADMIVVPMVGPDAYDISRRRVHEMKRKNCRMEPGVIPTREQCEHPDSANLGVDLNRNYGAFWGGPGSNTTNPSNMYYQGEGPFSEPETQNMRDLLATHQVTVAFNNHVPDRRLLRVPASVNEPVPADEEMYDELAKSLGAVLDWPATPWRSGLAVDTDRMEVDSGYSAASGVAEQTAYYMTGTLAFTPEATPGHSGLDKYHPPYEFVVDQYFGTGSYEGSDMREAMLLAFEAAADPARHAVITGDAPPETELEISRRIVLDTSPVPAAGGMVLPLDVTLRSTMTVPDSGEFAWHVNPSLRPSQYLTTHVRESWTVTCSGDGSSTAHEVVVTVGRGEVAPADMTACPAPS